jgi:beta-hydroxylase
MSAGPARRIDAKCFAQTADVRTLPSYDIIFYISGYILVQIVQLYAYGWRMETTPQPATAFKILTAAQWAQFAADGVFHGAPVDLADGYIHLSTQDQVQGTLDKHFAGQEGLVLAEVDLTALKDAIKWEPSRGGALFPHIYGDLPMHAIVGYLTQIKA